MSTTPLDLSPLGGTGSRERVDASINRLHHTIEHAVREATLFVGFDGRVVDTAKADVRLGVNAERLVGDHPLPTGWKMFDDDGANVALDEHPALVTLRTGEPCARVLTYEPCEPGTSPMRLHVESSPVVGDSQVAVNVLLVDNDRRRHARRMLEAQERRFRATTDMLPVAVWESTASGEVIYVNPKFAELTGRDVDDVPDLPMLQLVHRDDVAAVIGSAADSVERGGYHVEFRLLHIDGSTRWVTSTTTVLTDDEANVTGIVGVIEDIDELYQARQALEADAVEDQANAVEYAVSLSNGRQLNAAIADTLPGTHVGLLLVEIDHFKQINGEHGTEAGDAVLEHVGRCVSRVTDNSATVARVSADEIVVWAPGLADVETFARRIVDAVAGEPVATCHDARLAVGVTVGAASGPSERSRALMKYADTARMKAKRLGGNCSCVAPHLR